MRARLLVHLLLLGAALGLCEAAARADEVRIDDLRIEAAPQLGLNWRIAGYLNDDAPASGLHTHTVLAQSQGLNTHTRYGVGFYHSIAPLEADHGSFVVGAALSRDRQETLYGTVGRAWILDGYAGFAWAFTPTWHIEQGVILGVGRQRWNPHFQQWFFDYTDWHPEDTAWCYEYGMRLGTTYTLGRHVQAALDLRYLVTTARMNFSTTYSTSVDTETVSYKPRIRTEGLGAVAALGWRF